jgi:(p)ppGpp synthase/HD superfamily hydrolase
MLEKAIEMAVRAHTGQIRKDGSPYILHPLRVMLAFQDEPGRIGELLRAAAVLHDVCEDCGVSLGSIMDVSPEVGDIVDCLTHRTQKGYEVYADYILRCSRNPLARRVKIADLEDNLRNIDGLPDKNEAKGLRRRYEWALSVLR